MIIDNGKGIPKDALPHIFEPFFSMKKSEKNIGLGLSVVYGIIKEHGGTIDVESKEREGTKFTITLPRLPAAKRDA
jgi:signal transduction histidine kinase